MKIALGVTGGIAAYKAAEIARRLQERGLPVQVMMTDGGAGVRAAADLCRAYGRKGDHRDVFAARLELDAGLSVEHIGVAQSIDALLVAPATAATLARFAQGLAEDFLSTLYLATTAPVVVAPAMNVNMWRHPATQANLQTLRARGVTHRGAGRGIPGLRDDRRGTAGGYGCHCGSGAGADRAARGSEGRARFDLRRADL